MDGINSAQERRDAKGKEEEFAVEGWVFWLEDRKGKGKKGQLEGKKPEDKRSSRAGCVSLCQRLCRSA